MVMFLDPLCAGPPKIIEPDNTEVEESFENSVDLSCVVRGFPAPSITWSTADGKVQQKEASQKARAATQIHFVTMHAH